MLSPVEREILRDLSDHGDNVPSALADNISRHPKSVSRSLSNLEERGLVEKKNEYGVWTITDSGIEAV